MGCFKWGLVGHTSRDMEDIGAEGAFPAFLPATRLQQQGPETILDTLHFFVKQCQVFLKGSKQKVWGLLPS